MILAWGSVTFLQGCLLPSHAVRGLYVSWVLWLLSRFPLNHRDHREEETWHNGGTVGLVWGRKIGPVSR